MSAPAIQIHPFDGKAASQTKYAALNRHTNRMRLERLPDDPPIPLEETIQNLKNIPPFVDLKLWTAWNPDQSEILALGNVVMFRMEENKHLAQCEITVQPEYRRQGLGRQLLSLIADAALQENRRLLMTDTVDRVPGGEAFMRRLGAKKGMEAHTNQLRLADIDRGRIADWIAHGQGNRSEFELGFWDGAYPEGKLPEGAALYA